MDQTATADGGQQAISDRLKLTVDGCTLFHRGIPVRDMLAFPSELAALLIGISSVTLRREVARGKLFRTSFKTIPRDELLRYLRDELKPRKR